MEILDFEKQHIREATALALANYNDERQFVKELPQVGDIPDLNSLAENGLGVVAFEKGKMRGFLCGCAPFDNAFRATDVRGIFSPMGANAAVSENRPSIYAAMYQAAGAKWVQAGAVSHAICLYAHDEEAQRQFYRYGFGLRCMDAVRAMEQIHLRTDSVRGCLPGDRESFPCVGHSLPQVMELTDCEPCTGYDLAELPKAECHLVYPLHLALNSHYCESPFFMNRRPETQEEFVASSLQDGSRYFVAEQNGRLCAFLKISASGQTFAATGGSYRHITGAYCLPQCRGKGLYQNLLNFVISVLKREGCTRLGVNFESFNPTGCGFWLKYFTAYTGSVVRRIDERIMQRKIADM